MILFDLLTLNVNVACQGFVSYYYFDLGLDQHAL